MKKFVLRSAACFVSVVISYLLCTYPWEVMYYTKASQSIISLVNFIACLKIFFVDTHDTSVKDWFTNLFLVCGATALVISILVLFNMREQSLVLELHMILLFISKMASTIIEKTYPDTVTDQYSVKKD